jgi:hypothetical protein
MYTEAYLCSYFVAIYVAIYVTMNMKHFKNIMFSVSFLQLKRPCSA